MADNHCGAPTKKGPPCRFLARECKHHQGWREDIRARAGDVEVPPAQGSLPPVVAGHNLRDLAWWLVDRMVGADLPAPNASVIVAVMRILASLGPEPLAEAEALKQVELRGRIMHGQPPRTPEEWELAAAVFDDEALAEFHRWDDEIERLLAGSAALAPEDAADREFTTVELFRET